MAKTNRAKVIANAVLLIAALVAFWLGGSPASTQASNIQSTGPTTQDCFSARYHAASDCDRLASAHIVIPSTGVILHGPTRRDCFSTRFHAASDCDRLASEIVFEK
jgi:hypothetical protein